MLHGTEGVPRDCPFRGCLSVCTLGSCLASPTSESHIESHMRFQSLMTGLSHGCQVGLDGSRLTGQQVGPKNDEPGDPVPRGCQSHLVSHKLGPT